FQAEDGIRYFHVTGVQTCALPILLHEGPSAMNEQALHYPTPGSRALHDDRQRAARAAEGHESVTPGDIAVGVIIGRTSEFFDFFTYGIASVLVFPYVFFPFADAFTGTMYSFAIFALAFIFRPFGTALFMTIQRHW